MLLAQWALSAVVALGADLIPRAVEIRLDPVALVFTLMVTFITGLTIGLLPALQAARVNVNEALKDASRGSTAAGQRLRASLLVAEVSLSLVLLDRSRPAASELRSSSAGRAGVRARGHLHGTARRCRRSATPATSSSHSTSSCIRRLSTLPGSTSAALTDRVPLTGGQTPAPVAVVGRPVPPMSERPYANRHLVSPRYFTRSEFRLRAGRDFDERDSARVPHVVIINETFAARHFPGEDPIGRTLITGMGQLPSQIVGVVADVRSSGLNTAARGRLLPAGAAAARDLHQHPGANRPRSYRDGVDRAGCLAGGGPGSSAAPAGTAFHAHRADHRRPQAGTGAAGRIRRARAGARQPRASTA